MANKLALITLGNRRLYELDADPSLAGGFSANVGDLALADGRLFLKSGALATDWTAMADSSELANYIPTSEKGAANGVATLDANQKISLSQVPAIAITDTFVVASEVAMLALSTAEQGDVAVRTDLNKSFILIDNQYSVLASWQELLTPTDSVQSVNGQTGVVVLTSSDISEGTNLYFTEQRVRDTVLTGLDIVVDDIVATDTVLQALGKARGKFDAMGDYLMSDAGYETHQADGSSINPTGKNVVIQSGLTAGKIIVLPAPASLGALAGFRHEIFNFSEGGGVEIRKNDGVTVLATLGPKQKAVIIVDDPDTEAYASPAITYLQSSASIAMEMDARRIANVADPLNAQDVMTLAYSQENFWKNGSAVADLYDALAVRYFGTKSGDHDIEFYRNSSKKMSLGASLVQFHQNVSIDTPIEAFLTFASGVFTIGDTSTSGDVAILSEIITLEHGNGGHIQELQTGVSIVHKTGKVSANFQPSVAPQVITLAIPMASEVFAREAHMKVKLIIKRNFDGLNPSFIEKTVAVLSDGSSMSFDLVQDDFTHIASACSGMNVGLSANATFGTLNVNLSGYAEAADYNVYAIIEVTKTV